MPPPRLLVPGHSLFNHDEVPIDEAKLRAIFDSDPGLIACAKKMEVAKADYAAKEERCRQAKAHLGKAIWELNKEITRLRHKLAMHKQSKERVRERLAAGEQLGRMRTIQHEITIRKNYLRRREAKRVAAEMSEAYVRQAKKVR